MIDLQNLRLTCRKFNVIVTPFLFENMILDEKFQQKPQLKRIINFAAQNPALATCVKGLQHKMAPRIRRPLELKYMPDERFVEWAYTGQPFTVVKHQRRKGRRQDIALLDQLRTWAVHSHAREELWMIDNKMSYVVSI